MVTASAPGKVYLFGEHAVVYGEPAVPCAVDRRVRVTATGRADDRVRVTVRDLSLDGFTAEYDGGLDGSPAVDAPDRLVEAALAYVEGAVEQGRAVAGTPDAGFDVEVESDLPLGAGLGSSAAVVVATVAAVAAALGADLDDAALADRAYQVERDVQDGQASRADTFCSTTGGAVRVEGDDCRAIDAPALPITVGYDGGGGDTAELVAGVRSLTETYGFADDTVAAIGDLVERGLDALDRGDVAELGRLMDVNHGLLAALGVSARSLDEMVWAAREGGAGGAKLTGAGGGGCVVALDPEGSARTALELTPACEQAFAADLDRRGVRVGD
ncbi:MAG: mevalonate kinase [Halobacteriaceae archaeon]